MIERDIAAKLAKVLRAQLPKAVVFRHWDHITVMPDLSVTYRGRTPWFEVKYVKKGHGINQKQNQLLMMQKLGRTSFAFYLVYTESPPALYICPPWKDSTEWVQGQRFEGHAHEKVVELIVNLTGGR